MPQKLPFTLGKAMLQKKPEVLVLIGQAIR